MFNYFVITCASLIYICNRWKEGLVNISKIAPKRIEKVEDVLKVGDTVKVKYMGLDAKGRMDFSIKDAQ